MKQYKLYILLAAMAFTACDESNPEVEPNDENFPFRITLDTDEGAALADEEDYGLEVKFADYLGDLPNEAITLGYEFTDIEGSFEGIVEIDEILYKVEIDDCEYEREIAFTSSEIMLVPDPDLGSVPEEFAIIFKLPGFEDTEGGFAFNLISINTNANVLLNPDAAFEYEVFDNELAGEWIIDLSNEVVFNNFKKVFAGISPTLDGLTLTDIAGEAKVELEFKEGKIEIELTSPEIEIVCEEGETEEEEIHLEIEFEWDGEDGGLTLEGTYEIEDNGAVQEFDFEVNAEYSLEGDILSIKFFQVIDEDHWESGEEVFKNSAGLLFSFIKD